MDLYVERQCVEKMKAGEPGQFTLLYDANFDELYKYVARRVFEDKEIERVVRLVFLDAFGQIENTPTDISYLTWLYSLAKPRVWNYIAKESFPGRQGFIPGVKVKTEDPQEQELIGRIDNMMKKLSLEEREILRLKFFEQVADGDLITILEIEEGKVGSKIYRVLKRVYFLLFGESEEKKGVYFGELSGLFERMRLLEKIEVPGAFKLSIKTDLLNRIEKKNFAIDAEVVEDKRPKESPFEIKNENGETPKGSNDPAKIFVEAVKEMKEEEALNKQKAAEKFERRERIYDLIDKWKGVLVLIPAVLFVWIVAFVVINLGGFLSNGVLRGAPSDCEIEVVFEGEFSDAEKLNINKGVSDRLCGHFDVEKLLIVRSEDGVLDVSVDVPDWFLEYRFVKKVKDWRIKKYARTLSSNQEPGEV